MLVRDFNLNIYISRDSVIKSLYLDMRQQYDNGFDPYDPEQGNDGGAGGGAGGRSPFGHGQGGFHFQNGFPFGGGGFPGGAEFKMHF